MRGKKLCVNSTSYPRKINEQHSRYILYPNIDTPTLVIFTKFVDKTGQEWRRQWQTSVVIILELMSLPRHIYNPTFQKGEDLFLNIFFLGHWIFFLVVEMSVKMKENYLQHIDDITTLYWQLSIAVILSKEIISSKV